MAQSSDELVKREIIDYLGTELNGLKLMVFPESSNEDQKIFPKGLTFGINNVAYGSCDACWICENEWTNPFDNKKTNIKPVIALEGTDALNRGSSGNAQTQRFHHALGAVKAGLIGIYYLRKGNEKIRDDLYGMAYFASMNEKGYYLIMDDLEELKQLILSIQDPLKLKRFLKNKLKIMKNIFDTSFKERYASDWNKFAKARSTLIRKDNIIKYAGRSKRNFTDGAQRAGHIAVGEMYLTKYFFPDKKFYYLWPKMTKEDITYLDEHKKYDKEWALIRNEKNVVIVTLDDLKGLPNELKESFIKIKDKPLKGDAIRTFNKCVKQVMEGIENGTVVIDIQ